MSYNNLVVETSNYDPLNVLQKGRERSRSGKISGPRNFTSNMNKLIEERQRSASNSTSNKKNRPNITRDRADTAPTPSNSMLYGISQNNWKTILNSNKPIDKKFRNVLFRNYNTYRQKYSRSTNNERKNYNTLNKSRRNAKNNGSLIFKIHQMALNLRNKRNSYNIRSNERKLRNTNELQVISQSLIPHINVLLQNINFLLTKQSVGFRVTLSASKIGFSNKAVTLKIVDNILDDIEKIYKDNKDKINKFNKKYESTTYNTTNTLKDILEIEDVINKFSDLIEKLLIETEKLSSPGDFSKNKTVTEDTIHIVVNKIKGLFDKIKNGYQKINKIRHLNSLIS